MWLPETGVDEETLEALVSEGIKFTILAPWQAEATRKPGGDWKPVTEKTLTPSRAYRWSSSRFPGKGLGLFFFYSGLHDLINAKGGIPGAKLSERVQNRLGAGEAVQLIHTANDGEFYGHHNRWAETELAAAYDLLESDGLVPTNYGQFLELFPPPEEVRVKARTAWSCRHGLGRWTEDCGCRYNPKTRQTWRGPVLDALLWLGAELDALYESQAQGLLKDPWGARDRYVERMAEPRATAPFLSRECGRVPPDEGRLLALRLLELQRHRLAMLTSCAWFFDDVAGIEMQGAFRQAARALELARALGRDLFADFRSRLALAPSNDRKLPTGAEVFDLVRESGISLARAAAHFALYEGLAGVRQERAGRFSCRVLSKDGASYELEISESATGETARFKAEVRDTGRLDSSCRVGAETFTLDALFAEERAAVVSAVAARRGELREWLQAVARLDQAGDGADAVLSFLETWPSDVAPAQELPSLDAVRDHFTGARSPFLAENAAPASLARLERWLILAERHKLYPRPWELRDFVWRWRRSLRDRRASALELEFARALSRRLNFSDHAFEGTHGE
jgi:hypothetical protein